MSKSRLRVLHVLEATLGGTRRYLQDVAVATRNLPITQGLVYGTSRADPGFIELLQLARQAGWQLFSADALRRPVRPVADAQAVAAVTHAIAEFRPSILHLHSSKAGAVGRIASCAMWPRSPIVIYSPHALPARLGAGYMIAERALARFAKRFVAVSHSERDEIIASGIARPTVVDVVYPRIDTEAFAPRDRQQARTILKLPNVPIVIGIGRLAPQKDPLSFVRVLASARKSHPDLIGIWVGDGELRRPVEDLSDRLGLGSAFRISGWINDVRPYIAASDALLSTSEYESFGYVIPETFAMERPVVASRVVGTVDVFFPATSGTLYAPKNIEEGAKSVSSVLDDEGWRNEIGRLGRVSVIEKFSTGAMAAALTASYDNAFM